MIHPLVDTYTCGSSPSVLESRSCLLFSRLETGLDIFHCPPTPQREGLFAMAEKAQSSQVLKIALSSTFHYREAEKAAR
jgi:hypothetical protein